MKSDKFIIGLYGNAGSGKNSVAQILNTFFGYKQLSFAGPLKRACEILFGLSPEFYEQHRQLKEIPHPYWHLSPREIWQRFGTEAMRDTFGKDFWIILLSKAIENDTYSHFVISDVRFENEIAYVLNSGGVIIHLTRPEAASKVCTNHRSEWYTDLSRFNKDKIFKLINDGGLKELKHKTKQLHSLIMTKVEQSILFAK